MKRRFGVCAGLLAVAGWAAGASAQAPPGPGCAAPLPCLPAPVPGQPAMPGGTSATPTNPNGTQPSQQNDTQSAQQNEQSSQQNTGDEGNPLSGQGSSQGGQYGGANTAGGSGVGSATATGGGANSSAASSPLILPGLFTASQVESARPTDRVFFNYGYFDGFRAAISSIVPPVPDNGHFFQTRLQRGFNLNTFDFGVEKTFLDGRVSAIVRVPILDATDNITGQPIDGLGDVSAGLKAALLMDCETGSALSVGLDVDAPTGRNQVFVVNQPVEAGTGKKLPSQPGDPLITTTVNPTYLQPYVSGILNMDGLFVQNFLGVLVSTDGRISPFINEDLEAGYTLYRCPERMLSSVTPTLEAQFLLPTDHVGTGLVSGMNVTRGDNGPGVTSVPAFNFPDQLFLTEGVQLGLGQRSMLSLGVVEPLFGPKAFTIGGTVGINFFY